ncbi:MAG: PH domain-containing protein [Flavobacteriales bacterium]|nr:PH domain-containing protein [Flavobacteriales bacterium]
MKTFYSERSFWLGLILWGLTLPFLLHSLYIQNLIAIEIMSVTTIFIAIIWFETKYIISDSTLLVKIWIFTLRKIAIKKIKVIRESKSIISSPANSLDRIEITYNKYEVVLISPKNREEFLALLKSINPNIDISV